MQITFLGTRGEIDPKTKRHAMHTATLFSHKGKHVMVDCGATWLGKIERVNPDTIILTHAHPDHAFGLKEGAPCPVWATKKTWQLIDNFPIPQKQRRHIEPRKKRRICNIQFEAFPLLHSLRCPAVGYRITCGKLRLFYAPDVAWIEDADDALKNLTFYIGDGATIYRPMIRKKGNKIFGHATIRQQLTWCQKHEVPEMIITHCGSDIVKREKKAEKQIRTYAEERGVKVIIAYDGMVL
jgi:ribonuclease BN (tRNA processing enzyme)